MLADIIIKVSGKRITKKYDKNAAQDVRGRNADLTMVKRELNWEPSVSLENGLAKTYRLIESMVNKDNAGLRKEILPVPLAMIQY